MTDVTQSPPAPHRSRESLRSEFVIYFAIIFLAAMPLAAIAWALGLVRGGDMARKGPISRAWSQARIITPMIFSA